MQEEGAWRSVSFLFRLFMCLGTFLMSIRSSKFGTVQFFAGKYCFYYEFVTEEERGIRCIVYAMMNMCWLLRTVFRYSVEVQG